MQKPILTLMLAFLAGCSVPSTGQNPGGGSTSNIPAVLSNNLSAATSEAGNQTLTVELSSLDASPFTATYTRNLAFDVPGYEGYDVKETNLQRHFVALFARNPRQNLIAGAVSDGGQFNRFFNGATYARVDVYTQPTSGLASYTGSYGGLVTNNGGVAGDPPIRTTGDVLLNADFTNNSVNGAITNRVDLDGFGLQLVDLALTVTPIASDGTFLGDVEYLGNPNQKAGDFGGIFGGLQASDVAGVLVFHPINYDAKITETGVFILPCVTPGSGVACP